MYRINNAEWELHILEDLMEGYSMLPDARDQVVNEFMKGTSMYNCVIQDINASERLLESVTWALEHKGNLVIEIAGPQRHGKSTVARFIARIIHLLQQKLVPDDEKVHWEDRVIYDRSFSDMMHIMNTMVEGWLDEGLTKEECMERIKHYIFIFDEVLIEHGEGSQKARHDITNITDTVARAGIHFLFVSPRKRGIGNYFTIWVTGYDEHKHLNLCFYYDPNNICKGYMETPQVAETTKYEQSKTEGIFEIIRYGGRKRATVREFDQHEEIPITPDDIELTDDFRPYAVERATREYTDRAYSKILDLVMQNIPQSQVAETVYGTPEKQMQVSRIMREIGAKRLGYWFEDWWCLTHDLKPNTQKNSPIPDAILDGVPHSLKCYYTNRRTVTLQADELFPEMDYARQHNTSLILVFYNLLRGTLTTRTFPTADAVPSTISLKFSTSK